MSHYSVAVFSRNGGKDVDELLAPFDENMRVDRYVSHTNYVYRQDKIPV